jgi:hypothetical protein
MQVGCTTVRFLTAWLTCLLYDLYNVPSCQAMHLENPIPKYRRIVPKSRMPVQSTCHYFLAITLIIIQYTNCLKEHLCYF